MGIDRGLAHLMAMDDAVWARHASGWSVWTRVPILPVLLAALWSHHWIGWAALAPIGAVLLWTWLNPRVFAPPPSTHTWAAKATFGERVWLARAEIPIPRHHRNAALVLGLVGGIGFAVAVAAALAGWFWPMVLAGAIGFLGKLWFCDRMVWLYEDMKDADPRYRAWLRP